MSQRNPLPSLKTGFRRVRHANDTYWWVGLVRCNGQVVVECGHEHFNRDTSTGTNGRSARDCAERIIRGAELDTAAQHHASQIRTAWQRRGNAGFEVRIPRAQLEAAANESADAYLTRVAAARAAGQAATQPATPAPPAAQPHEIGELPDWWL